MHKLHVPNGACKRVPVYMLSPKFWFSVYCLAANKGGISLKQLTLTGDVNNSSSLFNSEVNIKEIKLTVEK